ncbi:Signal peptidase I [Methanosarcina siciliae C2J]|uniref:Signal peptidase I n=1 Tax=Methanosarcina siciliae C2J TaxID=1434118 RepID=A0A0E3PKU8_9EURY|nr:signal peptidase I [Methanosarcina siciliae]AKB35718.1 Signal peptidase I [Methanosarcina siciliae C2J]
MEKKEILQVVIVLVTALFLINTLIPLITGSEKAMVVLSGSMTPIMLPGDMIVVKSVNPDELTAGDVIAFRDPGGKDTFVTHRIVKIEREGEKRIFRTKGDANEEEDFFKVPDSDVVGKLIFVIPFAGYLPEVTKNKALFLLTVIIPSVIIILDEIRAIIEYSNPVRAHKIEHNNIKVSRRSYSMIMGKRLIAIFLVSGFIFSGIAIINLGETGSIVLQKDNKVENAGFLPSVCVLLPEDSKNRFAVEPWYALIPPNSEIQAIAPGNMNLTISSVPYVLPVFWVISLAEINPYLPVVAEIALYTSIFTAFMFPLWYRKIVLGRKIKRMRYKRLLMLWKRTLNLV